MAGTVIAAGAKILSTIGAIATNPVTQAVVTTAKVGSDIDKTQREKVAYDEQQAALEKAQKRERRDLRGAQQKAFGERKAKIDMQRRSLMGAGDTGSQYSISKAGTEGGSLTGVSLG